MSATKRVRIGTIGWSWREVVFLYHELLLLSLLRTNQGAFFQDVFCHATTGSPSSKYEHRRASALLRNIQNIRICMGKTYRFRNLRK